MPVSQYRDTLYGALFVLVCGPPAHADYEDAIATCARIATVDDRILCLENALRQSSSELGESRLEAAVSPKSAKQTVTSPPPEVAVSLSAAVATSALTDDAPVTDESYGLKEPRPAQEASTLQVTVASVRKNLSNRFIFETEDGQIWLQTDQRRTRYEDTPFKAEIRPGTMGSFFLKPDSSDVSVRVRREK